MTGTDLIVAAPWIAFGVVLAIVCFLLLRSNQAARRGPARRPAFPRSSRRDAEAASQAGEPGDEQFP